MSDSSDDLSDGELIDLGPTDYLEESARATEIISAGASTVSALAAVYTASRARKVAAPAKNEPEPRKLQLPPGVDSDENHGSRRC